MEKSERKNRLFFSTKPEFVRRPLASFVFHRSLSLSLSLSLLSTRSRALPPSPVPSLSAIASVRRLPLLSPHLKEKHSNAGEERKLFF